MMLLLLLLQRRPYWLFAALGEMVGDEPAGTIVASSDAGATFTTLLAPPAYTASSTKLNTASCQALNPPC
jgi:hypothetical protein